MYTLCEFCNIIATLRKEKGWTQVELAEKLGIVPQSISKWECGIGYPDVTMFPLIAEALSIPIGVLFGEKIRSEKRVKKMNVYSKAFAMCSNITIYLGNICRVEFIENEEDTIRIEAKGDSTFIRYLDAEYEDETLLVQVKNPCGSSIRWNSYDREEYEGENFVRIYLGKKDVNINAINYLDLNALSRENEKGNFEVVCSIDQDAIG